MLLRLLGLTPAAILAACLGGCTGGGAPARPDAAWSGDGRKDAGRPTAGGRAIALLASEVPRWSDENGCYSCHHNGDAARALMTAWRLRREPAGASLEHALASTVAWLSRPERWDDQKGDPAFSDRALARLQFAAALAMAVEASLVRDRGAVEVAGDSLASLQSDGGSWAVASGGAIGSPATWGTHLATAMTRRTLEGLDAERFRGPIERARSWLREEPPRSVLEAASTLIGLAGDEEPAARRRIDESLRAIDRGRAPFGGWGPYETSPPEAFDTALVLLGLRLLAPTTEVREWIREGRGFLTAGQEKDGGWPATTRPRGGQSYAQATSTSAWAAMALLLTEDS